MMYIGGLANIPLTGQMSRQISILILTSAKYAKFGLYLNYPSPSHTQLRPTDKPTYQGFEDDCTHSLSVICHKRGNPRERPRRVYTVCIRQGNPQGKLQPNEYLYHVCSVQARTTPAENASVKQLSQSYTRNFCPFNCFWSRFVIPT